MIKISNLRIEDAGEWTKLACDLDWESAEPNPFQERTLWFKTRKENADFFSTKVYDPFLMSPYYMAMQYGQDLKIEGCVSKKLYRNLTNYVERIWRDFSSELKPVKLIVDGYDVTEQDGNLIGASISCGVDSLSTLYDRFEKETDPEYRINAVFFFNCGSLGDYYAAHTNTLYNARYMLNKSTADELGLPIYQVESNIHSLYPHAIEQRLGFIAIWSCILSMQRKIRRYYMSSGLSYEEVIEMHDSCRNFDMDEACGSYLVPLIQTEGLELIYDGAQRRRTGKTQNIADWSVAQRHLSVCTVEKETAENCSCCSKCLRTLYALDFLGKLDKFSDVFDIQNYKKHRFKYLCQLQAEYRVDKFEHCFAADNIRFAKENDVKLPPRFIAFFFISPITNAKNIAKRLLGDKNYTKFKNIIKGKKVK